MSQISSFASYLALACEDGVLILWDLAQGEFLMEPRPSTEHLSIPQGGSRSLGIPSVASGPQSRDSGGSFPLLHSWDTLLSSYCPWALWECALCPAVHQVPFLVTLQGDILQPLPRSQREQVILQCLFGPAYQSAGTLLALELRDLESGRSEASSCWGWAAL